MTSTVNEPAGTPAAPAAPRELTLRAAGRDDLDLIRTLIEALAEYERLRHECRATNELLDEALFGPRRYAEVIIAEVRGVPAGFALFFHNFSTFLARPGIYLEDLFVKPEFRGFGVGRALLQRLAQLAVERRCGRLEWAVLDWNESAIGFYKKLGAVPQDEWTVFRVTGDALTALAAASGNAGVRAPGFAPASEAESAPAIHSAAADIPSTGDSV